jgi:hypothetical protein
MTATLASIVGGRERRAEQAFDLRSPASGEVLANVERASPEIVDAAVASARETFEGTRWAGLSERVAWCERTATLIDERAETLAAELADGALVFARAHRYTLVDRPRVDLLSDPMVARSDIMVDARFADPIAGRSSGPGRARRPEPPPDEAPDEAPDEDRASSTMVFTVPRPDGPRARLRLTEPDGHQREVPLDGQLLTLGRATDNGLVVSDGRVSRHHGRIAARRGTLVYTDLGSTNGTRVNGHPVAEVVLGVGDRIEVGDSLLVVEAVEAVGPAG